MPLLGFKSQFVPAVENGVASVERTRLPHAGVPPKRQTIRASRRDGRDPVAGDTLHLYTGLRTRAVRKLGEVRCRAAKPLRIARSRGKVSVKVDGETLDAAGLRRLAREDGFDSVEAFLAFFSKLHGLPFAGWLIRW